MAPLKSVSLIAILITVAFAADPAPHELSVGDKFAATDTLACDDEPNADAAECLKTLSWEPGKFMVQLEAAQPGNGDFLVRFSSPRPIGDRVNDQVAMEWYAARDAKGVIRSARAVVIVHESARSMPGGRMIARSLNWQGLHTFLIHLPNYGARRAPGSPSSYERILPMMQQGVADVRRARDAVAALPQVDGSVVGLEGTSLGGFVTATVAGLDRGYDRTFILLAGGNIADVILHGSRDAAKVHEKLRASGLTDEQIQEAAHRIEPLRLAHRINPDTTWLFSGELDTVVPPKNSRALAKAAKLPKDHHVEFAADHYLGIVYLPAAVMQIAERMGVVPVAVPAATVKASP